MAAEPNAVLQAAAELLGAKQRILVYTGAGISTESGIPDFRGPGGIWTKLDPADFTFDRYLTDPAFRRTSWERRFTSPHLDAEPNAAHRAVAELWRAGRMIGCVTQNVDRLHHAAGLPPEAIVELHGNVAEIGCLECATDADPVAVRARWEAGDLDPECEDCGGILKTRTIAFGQSLPQGAMDRAMQWADGADAALVVGSTISVYPAAYVPLRVASRGEPLVILNLGPTDHDGAATVRLEGKAGNLLPRLVELLSGA